MTWQKVWRSLKTPGLFGLRWRVKTTYTYACPPGHPHAGTRQEVWGFELRTPSATAPACHRRGKRLCAPLQNYFLYCRLSLLCKSFPSCHVPQNPHKKENRDFSDLYVIPDFNHKTQYKQEIPLTEKNGQLIHLYLLFSHGKKIYIQKWRNLLEATQLAMEEWERTLVAPSSFYELPRKAKWPST